MSIKVTHKETEFGVGDVIKVYQVVTEGDKKRTQVFEGTVISIKGRGELKTFTVRRMGAQQVGIERIFPLESPIIEKIEVVRPGTSGIRRAKLYYTREKSTKEIEKIYSRTNKESSQKKIQKHAAKKKASKDKKSK